MSSNDRLEAISPALSACIGPTQPEWAGLVGPGMHSPTVGLNMIGIGIEQLSEETKRLRARPLLPARSCCSGPILLRLAFGGKGAVKRR